MSTIKGSEFRAFRTKHGLSLQEIADILRLKSRQHIHIAEKRADTPVPNIMWLFYRYVAVFGLSKARKDFFNGWSDTGTE